MPPRAPFIDYEENNLWAKTALQACILHDIMLDAIKVFYGLDLEVGLRAVTPRPIGNGIRVLADDFKDRGKELPLPLFISQNFLVQARKEDNSIDLKVLDHMKKVFIAFVANDLLEVAETDRYGGRQLMVRSQNGVSQGSVSQSTATALTGLEYICFPIPEDEQTPPKYKGMFNEEFCFVNPKGRGFIQLGPASLLNHHCDANLRNINQEGLKQDRRYLMASYLLKPNPTRMIKAGEELLIDYGPNWFGTNNRKCLCSSRHPRITLFSSNSWSSVQQTSDSIPEDSDVPATPRASRAKRRLTISESTRPQIMNAAEAVRPRSTMRKVEMSSRSRGAAAMVSDSFAEDESSSDESSSEDEESCAPARSHPQKASNPPTPRKRSMSISSKAKHGSATAGVREQIGSIKDQLTGSSGSVARKSAKKANKPTTSLTITGTSTISRVAGATAGPVSSTSEHCINQAISGAGEPSSSLAANRKSIVTGLAHRSERVVPRAEDFFEAEPMTHSTDEPITPASRVVHIPPLSFPPRDRTALVNRYETSSTKPMIQTIAAEVSAQHTVGEAHTSYTISPVDSPLPSAQSPFTPGLFGSDDESSDDSLYDQTPHAPDIPQSERAFNIPLSRDPETVEHSIWDGTESELEYFELYGEPRAGDEVKQEMGNDEYGLGSEVGDVDVEGEMKSGKNETEEDASSEAEAMDICTEDENSGPTSQVKQENPIQQWRTGIA